MTLTLLRGVRVVEFTHVWAGPYLGQVLADLGAEVVKVESRAQIDVHRRAGPYADREPGLNRSGVWNTQNRGKRGCTINLRTAEGAEIAARLAGTADVLVDNFAPGALERRGLGSQLRARHPRLVMVSLSGYGLDGPWRDFPAYGPMMDAVSGLSWAVRDHDGQPQSVNGWLPDTSAALYGACAAIAGVLHARRTGIGLHFDISQLEAAASLLPELVGLEARGSAGSQAPPGAAFALTAACRHHEWLYLRLDDSAGWARLAAGTGWDLPPLAAAAELRAAVERHLAGCDRAAVCTALQAADVECVPVLTSADLDGNVQLAARGAFVTVDHAELGPMRAYGPVVRALAAGQQPDRAAPVMGQDNQSVFTELLGMDPATISRLETEQVLW